MRIQGVKPLDFFGLKKDIYVVRIERKIIRKLGKQIREFREAKGWSLEELADAAKVDTSHLGKLERGEGNPTVELIVRLATALDADVILLLEANQ